MLPEQESRVSFQYVLPSPFYSSVSTFLLFVLVILFLVWMIYRKNSAHLSPVKKWSLFLLRTVSFLLLLLFLVQLSLKVDLVDKPGLVILIDQSKSMTLQDDYGNKTNSLDKYGMIRDVRYPVRMDMVKAILSDNQSQLLKNLEKKYHPYLYFFSEKSVPLKSTESINLEELTASLLEVKPEGKQSLIASSVREVLGDFRGKPPAAIVLFTDGISSAGQSQQLSDVAEEALGQYVPLYPVGVGSQRKIKDVALTFLDVDEVAYVNNPLRFIVSLSSDGYQDQPVKLKLIRKNDSKILEEKTVSLKENQGITTTEFLYVPEQTGKIEFAIDAEPVKDELDRENNQISRNVEIREENLKVLMIEGSPRWEFRALKSMLEREESITLNTFLQDSDLEYASADKTALNHLPVKLSELLEYDVIIWGDVDITAFSEQNIKNLVDYVVKGHGGFLVIAGNVQSPGEWANTEFTKLLPFLKEEQESQNQLNYSGEIAIATTDQGKSQFPFFQFGMNEEESGKIFKQFPPIYWYYESGKLKPGVISLVTTEDPAELPIITFHRAGNGKVLFHFTDELWRWRFRSGDTYYSQYWGKAIRYLSRSRVKGTSNIAELAVDREEVEQGEDLGFYFRLYDGSALPLDQNELKFQIESSDGKSSQITLERDPKDPLEFLGSWTAGEPGEYRVSIENAPAGLKFPETDFTVKNVDQELKTRKLALDDMKKAAEISEGKYLEITEVEKLPAILPDGVPVVLDSPVLIPLWKRWELLVFFSILLGVEWIIRKRNRLN